MRIFFTKHELLKKVKQKKYHAFYVTDVEIELTVEIEPAVEIEPFYCHCCGNYACCIN